MGTILLIGDDRKFRGLIERILQKKDLKVFSGSPFDQKGSWKTPKGQDMQGNTSLVLEEAVREYFKQIDAKNDGRIHEFIVGKVERALIGIILEEAKGNQVQTARRLGMNRNTLRKKMKDLQIVTRVVTG